FRSFGRRRRSAEFRRNTSYGGMCGRGRRCHSRTPCGWADGNGREKFGRSVRAYKGRKNREPQSPYRRLKRAKYLGRRDIGRSENRLHRLGLDTAERACARQRRPWPAPTCGGELRCFGKDTFVWKNRFFERFRRRGRNSFRSPPSTRRPLVSKNYVLSEMRKAKSRNRHLLPKLRNRSGGRVERPGDRL